MEFILQKAKRRDEKSPKKSWKTETSVKQKMRRIGIR